METTFINRYNIKNTFTQIDKKTYRWDGDFAYSRCSFKTCSKKAYAKFLEDHPNTTATHEDFESKLFEWDEFTKSYDPRYEQYQNMIEPLKKYDMVDPSGGPFLASGMEVPGTTDIIDFFDESLDGKYYIIHVRQ